jgi:uncharacterized membrane protein YgcG
MEKILAVIIAVVAAVIVMGFFLVRRKSNRRLAEIKEAKEAFAKRVGIPQRYAKAYEDAKTERDIIDIAILVAQSRGMWGTSAHLSVFIHGDLPFSKVMRSLAVGIDNADKNAEANHGAKEAGFPTPIFRDRRVATSTNSVTEHHHRRYRDDDDDYTLPVAAAVFTAVHSSSSCNTVSYERSHACERSSFGYHGGGESSDGGGGGSSCGDSGGGGD